MVRAEMRQIPQNERIVYSRRGGLFWLCLLSFSFSNPRAVVVSYISVRRIDACLLNCMFDIGLCVCCESVLAVDPVQLSGPALEINDRYVV